MTFFIGFSFILSTLFPHGDLCKLWKLAELYQHFQHHQQEHGDSFIDFVYQDYLSDAGNEADHHDAPESPEHPSHHHSDSGMCCSYFPPADLGLDVRQTLAAALQPAVVYRSSYSYIFQSSVFQPPLA